jgi:hypothetical protein
MSRMKIKQASDMDLDAALALSLHAMQRMRNQSIPTHMEEDQEDVDLDGLTSSNLRTACKQKEYNSIPPGK